MHKPCNERKAANCSKHSDRLQNLDVITPDLFDKGYYRALTFNKGVFTSDMALIKNRTTAAIVKKFTESKEAFFTQFARSMDKLARAPKPARNDIRRKFFMRNGQRAAIELTVVDADEEEGFKASA